MKYFLHDSNSFNDEKITELFIKFGYEGLGLFYTMLEKIASQEKPIKTSVLKAQLKVGKRLEKCWNFMEQIDLISSNNGETFNKHLLNFSETYKIKKEKNAKRILEWREKQQLTENVTRSENVRNTSKVKLSKVKKNKYIKEEVQTYFFLGDDPQTKFEKYCYWIRTDRTNVYGLKSQMTENEFNILSIEYGDEALKLIIDQMENKSDLQKKYISVYLTANNWLKK